MAGSPNLPTENISDVILRLLKLKAGEELDYQTYLTLIKKRLALHRMAGFKVPAEEDELLRIEFKRALKLKDKGRFKVAERKTKVSTPSGSRKPGDFVPNGPNGGGRKPNGPKTASIVKTPKGKISTEKFFYEPGVEQVKVKDVTEKTTGVKKELDILERIDKRLDSIIESLTGIDKENKKRSEKERKESERKRRGEREKGLEAKPFEGIKKAISTLLKPFQSVWDIIKNFILNVILGRIVLKLLDWFADPKNQEKIQSIIRFFGDHWPTLLALYLRFGTGLGRFIGRLGGVLIKGAFKLGAWTAKLAAKAGLKGAGKVAKFLGGKKGRAIATGLGIAADVAVTAGTAIGVKKLMGGEEEKAPPTQQFSGGGSVKVPKFAGGGFNFKGMLGGASLGTMFGPLGMLLGGAFGSEKPQEMVSGFVSGEKGVDKVPAMLSDGEFVMSRGAVQKYGVGTLEAMNAAGGGTNKPKIMSGKTYAQGGGLIATADKASDPSTAKNAQKLKEQKNKENKDIKSSLNSASKSTESIDQRLKRIESQIQVQRALASGKGINIKGAQLGSNIGTGYGAKYRGRDAVKVKLPLGGSYESEITLAGKRYFAMKQGDNIIYTSQDPRDRNGGGFLQPGGLFGGPRMSARMNYAASKGKYYSSSDQKTYGNYNDAKAAKKSRMTSLESQQRLNKLSAKGAGPRTGRGIRYTTEAVTAERERINRGGIMGQLGRSLTRMFSDPDSKLGKERIAKLDAADKASTARVKQAGAASIGRYYSSVTGKYYKDYSAALREPAVKSALAKQEKEKKQFESKNPGAKLYDKPQANTGQPYKSRFSRPVNAGVKPVKPPASKVKVIKAPKRTKANTIGKGSGGVTKSPSFSANHGKTNTGSKTLGVNKK